MRPSQAKEAVKKTHVDRALEHFDDFYGTVYKDRWPSLRLGMIHKVYMKKAKVFDQISTMFLYNLKDYYVRQNT